MLLFIINVELSPEQIGLGLTAILMLGNGFTFTISLLMVF